jgi:methylmalonyl-CoA mutase cobalamin-binding domain/chain
MRQYAGYASAEESNARYRYLLAQGQTGISVAFDLPTQLCMDADDPLASGEVGKTGVSVSTLADARELFRDIPLDKISTSMTINAPAAVLLALYIAVAKEQGVAALQRRSAAVEHHQHQRLSHSRSRQHRRAGSGLHAGQRHRLRAGGAGGRAGRR